ncbi:MAG TPA: cation:proton antiporter [Thermoanaerobaculia bacterium]|jgi:CPA2 family monovalent cation:H+ antiporter-2|nr:cation:proton antiporter [Thermoanaerobaculia bacterium]
MHGESLLIDVAIILLAAFPLLFLGRRFRVPEVLSFIVAGIVIGPHALGLIADMERIEAIAEIGVALILFFIGLHVPLGRLRALGRTAFLGGPVQMALTIALVTAIAFTFAIPLRLGIFYGVLIALGSTAVVMPILTMRDEVAAPFARRFLGVSLFQDLAVIPLMLLLPAFAAGTKDAPSGTAIVQRVAFSIVGVIVLIVVARKVVPWLFRATARLGREAFTAGAIVLMIGTIAIAERLGISPALGAFAAGLVVGDTDFIHEIEGILRPFRDFLSALFFTSIGMLLSPAYVFWNPLLVLAIVLGVVILKVLAAYPAFRVSRAMRRTSVRAAFAIAPIGEFSFLLAQAGKDIGLLGDETEQTFVAVAVVTLAATPLLVSAGKWISERIHETDLEEHADHGEQLLHRHIIIVGYGLNGQNVARVLVSTQIRHVVLDEDPDRIVAARENGSRALLADAADPQALELAGIDKALAVIVAISDPDGTRRIASFCRKLNPSVHIIVRTRYVAEVERLRALGADEIIPEEFETSLEIVERVLRVLCVPQNIVANQLRVLRDEGYLMLRDPAVRADHRRMSALFAGGTSQTYLVLPGTFAEGRTIAELDLTEGVAVAALLREGRALSPLPLDEPLQAGDTMLLVGAHEDLTSAIARLEH